MVTADITFSVDMGLSMDMRIHSMLMWQFDRCGHAMPICKRR